MFHEVRQVSNRAAAIVKWLEVIAAQLLTSWIGTFFIAIMQLKPNKVLFHHTPTLILLQFKKRLLHA